MLISNICVVRAPYTENMTISALYIYPIKSLGGIAVSDVTVEPKGFRYDRRQEVSGDDPVGLRSRYTPSLADLPCAGPPTIRPT